MSEWLDPLLAEPFFCLLDFGVLGKEKDKRRLCSQGEWLQCLP